VLSNIVQRLNYRGVDPMEIKNLWSKPEACPVTAVTKKILKGISIMMQSVPWRVAGDMISG
jgi:hypothetical protein